MTLHEQRYEIGAGGWLDLGGVRVLIPAAATTAEQVARAIELQSDWRALVVDGAIRLMPPEPVPARAPVLAVLPPELTPAVWRNRAERRRAHATVRRQRRDNDRAARGQKGTR